MKQEERQLLLKDLSARLPHDVKIEITWWVMGEGTSMNTTLEPDHIEQLFNDEYGDTEIKPYLRPMSSMTEEEREELSNYENTIQRADFFYSHHLDPRNLIEKGLALEAPEGMYEK